MSKIEVDAIEPQSGTALTVGDNGDTITVPSGAVLTTTNATVNLPATTTVTTELKTNKISPASGTAFTLGDSGDTFTVPAGATIVNSGTATGFGGGSWTLLNAQTVSNAATLDFESIISSTYNLYAIHVFDFHPVSGGAELYLQSSENNGSSYNSSSYQFHVTKTNADDSSYLADVSTGTTGYVLSDNVKADNVENFHGLVFISSDFNSGYQPKFWHQAFTKSAATGQSTFHTGAGTYNGSQSSATNALRLTFSTGNISAGTATIYGIAKS
tara:strand:- start:268 stop:1080 length:813 start_codon:yes stop_codon:yes gene_type:complete